MTTSSFGAYDQAIKYLSIKMHSRADLESKLRRKNYDLNEIKQTLALLEEEGFIDDKKYAEVYLKNLVLYKTFGYYGIRNKLLQKKLSKDLIENLLKNELSLSKEMEIAQRLIQKPAYVSRPKKSLAQSLQQKGFRKEIILKILNSKR